MKDEFCKFCDYGYNGTYDCPTDQEARVESGRCVDSAISGVNVETYTDQVRICGTRKTLPLDDVAIFQAIHDQIIAREEKATS